MGSYIQLETFCKDKNFSRVIHMAQTDASKPLFRLGRGHDSELKISDISVSRVHAQIIMTEKGYKLEDNGSKFGTLILLAPGRHEVDPSNGLSLQVSRTTLALAVRPNEAANKAGPVAAAASGELIHGSPTAGGNSEGDNNSENVSGDEAQKNPLPEAVSKKTVITFKGNGGDEKSNS